MLYQFCPCCGGRLTKTDSAAPQCQTCHYIFYQNSAPAFGALIMNEQGQVLLAKRQHEPEQGKWDLPGGFLDYGEEAEAALKRELEEELNITAVKYELLDSEIGDYVFQGREFKTLNLFYLVTEYQGTIVAKDDVASVYWFDKQNIPTSGWAFNWISKVITRWQNS
ncbi:NUDIX domain-containing protein [Candidatus Falkowbacteria bacterium]|nr:NUDIX domain-containing protein [Candidatus Falkowbacteria bacterium]